MPPRPSPCAALPSSDPSDHDGAAPRVSVATTRPHTGATGTDDEHVALVGEVALARHGQEAGCGESTTNHPAWGIRMYTSAKRTEKRLTQAHTGWRAFSVVSPRRARLRTLPRRAVE